MCRIDFYPDLIIFLFFLKATMVIPEDREGRNNTNPDLVRDDGNEKESLNNATRKGGGLSQDKKPTPKIIVDMREFNSELPGSDRFQFFSLGNLTEKWL